MHLNFGHWEIFKLLITALRDIEKHQPSAKSIFDFDGQDLYPMPTNVRQKSTMEKQVKFCRSQETVFVVFYSSTAGSLLNSIHSFNVTFNSLCVSFSFDMQPKVHDYEYLQVQQSL